MIARIVGRFRTLLPPAAYVVCYAVIYLAASAPKILSRIGGNAAVLDDSMSFVPAFVHLFGAFLFGIHRAIGFHPGFRPGYRGWLETTPWTWGKPLPAGPAHLTGVDFLILTAAGLPSWFGDGVNPAATFASALAGYLLMLASRFNQTGAWGFSYLAVFGVGLALRLHGHGPEAYGAAILATYAVALVGLRRSFRRWPWPELGSAAAQTTPSPGNAANTVFQVNLHPDDPPEEGSPPPEPLGWPHDRLGPHPIPVVRARDRLGRLFSSLMIGWWVYVIAAVIPDPGGQLVLLRGLILNAVMVVLATRTSVYMAGYASPTSLGGRIARLRLIVPSYDRVFLVPITAVFLVSVGPSLLASARIPVSVGLPISAALAAIAISLGGPERRAWQLTAKARIVPGLGSPSKVNPFVQTG